MSRFVVNGKIIIGSRISVGKFYYRKHEVKFYTGFTTFSLAGSGAAGGFSPILDF